MAEEVKDPPVQDNTKTVEGQQAAADKAASDKDAATDAAKTKEGVDTGKSDADGQAAKAKADADAKAAQVPEKYELKLPDGVIVDEPMMTKFTAWAKENKFTNAQAQKAAEIHLEAIGAFVAKTVAEQEKIQTDWVTEMKDDKDLGGVNLDKTLGTSRKVLNFFGTARLNADLERTGMGDHPDLIRLLNIVGQQLGEDKTWVPSQKPAGPKSPEEVLYGGKSAN